MVTKTLVSAGSAVASQFEEQALNSIVGGFSFASAVAWMDVTRFLISKVIKVQKNGAQYYLMTALMTTLLSIVVFMVTKSISKKVQKPTAPVYAVSG